MGRCEHELREIGGIGVVACADCATVDWWGVEGLVPATEALDRLFGSLDLVDRLRAIGSPATVVFTYRATSRRDRRHLEVFPPHVWLRAHPHLWLCTDGDFLLLAPTDPAVTRRLDQGA